jgi:hypothetical protein
MQNNALAMRMLMTTKEKPPMNIMSMMGSMTINITPIIMIILTVSMDTTMSTR